MKHSRSGIRSSLLFSICTTSNRRWLCLAAAIFSFSGHTLRAAPGDLYSSDFVDATVIRYSADGTKTTVATTPGSALTGIAFDGKGNLFVAQYPANKIMKVTPRGDKSTFVQGLKPAALAFDRFGNLYAGDETTNSIVRFAPDGTRTTVVTGVSGSALAFDGSGVLYVARGNAGVARLVRGLLSNFVTGIDAQGLAFNAAGDLFVSDAIHGTITRVTPAAVKTPFANVPDAAGLAFDSTGNLFVSQLAGAGAILLVTPNGVVTNFAAGGTSPGFLATETASHQLLNISTRGMVGTGDHVLIAGFIVGGSGQVDGKVIVRALGPSLPIPGALQDPTLTLFDSGGMAVATNDNWKTSQAAVTATGIPPTDNREAAIVASLPAGNYTAVVSGVGKTMGDALVEVYNIQ